MEIISLFESALEEKNSEKLFRARIMMKAFGYNKWERFEGAIARAMESLSDEQRKNNFFPVEIKSTGGRPGRDFLITRGGCYILLKFCDGRKSEVQELKRYLEKLYLSTKIQTKKVGNRDKKLSDYISLEAGVLVCFLGFILFTVIYLAQMLSFFKTPENEFFVPKDLFTKEEVSQIQQQYIDLDQQMRPEIPEEKEVGNTFEQNLQNYIIVGGGDLGIQGQSNPRSEFTQTLTGTQMIDSYFKLGNAGLYKESCSLLDRKTCNALSLSPNLGGFVNFWEKTQFGNEVLNIKKVSEGKYCVKYKYKLKNDRSPDFIEETFQYHTNMEDGKEEITARFCEKIIKGSRMLNCPFVLNEYICD